MNDINKTNTKTDSSLDDKYLLQTGHTIIDQNDMNIKSYGAIGDGIHDDTAAIQSCMDYVDDHGGGTLFFPAGVYKIKHSLTKKIHNPISFVGSIGTVIDGRESQEECLLKISGSSREEVILKKDVIKGSYKMVVNGDLSEGDILLITSKDLWNPARKYYYKGEMVEVESCSGSIVTVKGPFFDYYKAENTKVYRLNMPKVIISGLQIKRDSNHTGLLIEYGRDIEVSNITVSGARKQGICLWHIYSGNIVNCSVTDCWFPGSGLSYGIVLNSVQYINILGGKYIGGRHGIAHGGHEPVRHVYISGVTVGNHLSSKQASFDVHGNGEFISLRNSVILNGVDIAGINVSISDSTIYESNIGYGLRWIGEIGGQYLTISGNRILTNTQGSAGIMILPAQPGINISVVNINGNICNTKGGGVFIRPYSRKSTSFHIQSLCLMDNTVSSETGDSIDIESFYCIDIRVDEIKMMGGRYESKGKKTLYMDIINNTRVMILGSSFLCQKKNYYGMIICNAGDVIVANCLIQGADPHSISNIFGNTGILHFTNNIVRNFTKNQGITYDGSESIVKGRKPSCTIIKDNFIR